MEIVIHAIGILIALGLVYFVGRKFYQKYKERKED